MARTGRPNSYKPKLGQVICERIAAGETLVSICKRAGMPSIATVLGPWISEHPEFSILYARAKQIRLDVMAEEIQHLSDSARKGKKVERKHVGWECSACGKEITWHRKKGWRHDPEGDGGEYTPICEGAKRVEVTEEKIVVGDAVERAKLQVDTRKWLLARLASKTYGDRVSFGDNEGGGASIQLVVMPAGAQPAKEPAS